MVKGIKTNITVRSEGPLQKELPAGDKILLYFCVNCGEYIKRENVTLGDSVFDVNLAIKCKCGHSFFLAIKGKT